METRFTTSRSVGIDASASTVWVVLSDLESIHRTASTPRVPSLTQYDRLIDSIQPAEVLPCGRH